MKIRWSPAPALLDDSTTAMKGYRIKRLEVPPGQKQKEKQQRRRKEWLMQSSVTKEPFEIVVGTSKFTYFITDFSNSAYGVDNGHLRNHHCLDSHHHHDTAVLRYSAKATIIKLSYK
jgi:hypothetical protein